MSVPHALGCLRATLGPSGLGVMKLVLAQLRRPVSGHLTLDGLDVDKLAGEGSLADALRLTAIADPIDLAKPVGAPLSLEAELDLAAVGAALSRLSPMDAVRGSVAASAYAAQLLYGELLRNAGPLVVTGWQMGKSAGVEVKLPLR